jgi:hypothetical protein
MVSAVDPYDCNLGFLDRSRYFFFQVDLQLYSRGAHAHTHKKSSNAELDSDVPGLPAHTVRLHSQHTVGWVHHFNLADVGKQHDNLSDYGLRGVIAQRTTVCRM